MQLDVIHTSILGLPRASSHTFTAVRLNGIPSMPIGRREGIGPYEPSHRFRKRRCVRGVPTCWPHHSFRKGA